MILWFESIFNHLSSGSSAKLFTYVILWLECGVFGWWLRVFGLWFKLWFLSFLPLLLIQLFRCIDENNWLLDSLSCWLCLIYCWSVVAADADVFCHVYCPYYAHHLDVVFLYIVYLNYYYHSDLISDDEANRLEAFRNNSRLAWNIEAQYQVVTNQNYHLNEILI